jgi:hypothetical protein
MKWAGHKECMGGERKLCKVLVGSLKERDRSEDRSVDERMGSEWNLGRLAGRVWSGCSWLRVGISGSCEHGDEHSGSGATKLIS